MASSALQTLAGARSFPPEQRQPGRGEGLYGPLSPSCAQLKIGKGRIGSGTPGHFALGRSGRTLCPATGVPRCVQLEHTCPNGTAGDPKPLASAGSRLRVGGLKGRLVIIVPGRANRGRRGRPGIGAKVRQPLNSRDHAPVNSCTIRR